MTTPLKLTDQQVVEFLRRRAGDPPPGLVAEYVNRARTEPQVRRRVIDGWGAPTVSRIVGFGLAAAAVVILAVIGVRLVLGLNIGGPPPVPGPTVTPSPSASVPSTSSWMTGRELMDTLSEQYGYEWSAVTGTTWAYSANSSGEGGELRLDAPLEEAADVAVGASVDEWRAAGIQLPALDRVRRLIAPDLSAWLANALVKGLECLDQGMPDDRFFLLDTTNATGGHVGVFVMNDPTIASWAQVVYQPEPFAGGDPLPYSPRDRWNTGSSCP